MLTTKPKNGFKSGHEMDDWFEVEKEVKANVAICSDKLRDLVKPVYYANFGKNKFVK
jgi:hypothetical protein